MNRGNDFDGLLIAVEGIDGSGKSTVVEAIEQWAAGADEDVVTTAEPTDLWTGEQVRRNGLDDDTPPLTDFSLFVADRVNHVHQRIVPALDRGAVVVTDRYADSTRAYQTHRIAEQMGMSYYEAREWMENVFDPWNVEPDLTIFIDIPVDVAMERAAGEDKYERRENLERVKEAYDDLYHRCDGGVRVLDGTNAKSVVRHKAINAVKAQLHQQSVEDERRARSYLDAIEES